MDPYEVLGVSRNAGDDEIKRAYRELSRKYHPDSYVGNPLSSLAEEKFKQVQEAYNTIMRERSGGYYNSSSNSFSGSYSNNDYEFDEIVRLLNVRAYGDALSRLDRMQNRNARWHYLSAIANIGIGNTMRGMEYARMAVAMEPGNMEYQRLLSQLNFQGQRYSGVRSGYSNNVGFGRDNTCNDCSDALCKLWCADTLCECMGGDLCRCM